MNKNKLLKYDAFNSKLKLPYVDEKYYYIGESNEGFTQGCQYTVVEFSRHWLFKDYGFVAFMTNDEYLKTNDIDYCVACDLNEFVDTKQLKFVKY